MPGVLDNSDQLDALELAEVERLMRLPEERERFIISSVAALNKEAGRARENCTAACRPAIDKRITSLETAVSEARTAVLTVAKVCTAVLAGAGLGVAIYEVFK